MRRWLLVAWLCGCPVEPSVDASVPVPEGDGGAVDGGVSIDDAGAPDAGRDAGVELAAVVGPDVWLEVDEPLRFDGAASPGARAWEWSFGDGSPPERGATVVHAFSRPGRYRVVLRVFDDARRSRSAVQLVAVGYWPGFARNGGSSVIALGRGAAVVVTDADLLVQVLPGDGGFVTTRTPTCHEPVALTAFRSEDLVVACRSGVLERHLDGARSSFRFPAGSRPVSVLPLEGRRFAVALNGLNAVAWLRAPLTGGLELDRLDDAPDPFGLAPLPDGGIVSGRFRSVADGGLLTSLPGRQQLSLAIDPQPSSDTELGGIPNLLAHLATSPDGRLLAVSGLQANILEGTFRAAKPLTFETTVRAITSFVDLTRRAEQFDRRKQWDNRGAAGAIAFSPRGDFLFVAMPANGLVERYDVLDDAPSGTLFDVGDDLRGLAVSDDGLLFVDAQLSRELVIYDVRDMRTVPERPIARLRTVEAEPLPPVILQGKRLFFDAKDPRLTREGYIACSHCHPDGDEDGLVWDFTDRGEGLRNTLSLLGRAGTGDGPIHWSGNFDEVQDFEGDVRHAFGGTGLLSDAGWSSGTVSQPLGDSKAGRSADLDALAAYVSSLRAAPEPLDAGSPEIARGRAIFERPSTACSTCHAGPRLTDSRFLDAGVPLLHDVGTLRPGSGKRLNGPLPGLDTPSLLGAWRNPPFLHDGSAPTLRDVLTTKNPDDWHGTTTTLTPAELSDLEAWLRSL